MSIQTFYLLYGVWQFLISSKKHLVLHKLNRMKSLWFHGSWIWTIPNQWVSLSWGPGDTNAYRYTFSIFSKHRLWRNSCLASVLASRKWWSCLYRWLAWIECWILVYRRTCFRSSSFWKSANTVPFQSVALKGEVNVQ